MSKPHANAMLADAGDSLLIKNANESRSERGLV